MDGAGEVRFRLDHKVRSKGKLRPTISPRPGAELRFSAAATNARRNMVTCLISVLWSVIGRNR
jgi:hypothetical protein